MINLAGNNECDTYIENELLLAGIKTYKKPFKNTGEVPYTIYGELYGWCFKRSWRYWIAFNDNKNLLFEFADPLHEKFGQDVRVAGYFGYPAPKELYNDTGVNLYHIDTQSGLNALVEAIKKQEEGDKK